MDRKEENLSITVYKPLNYRFMNGSTLQQPSSSSSSSGWLEIRLFYVRIAPCAVQTVPDHLTLRHLRREIGVSLEINNARVPSSETANITLRRDRVDKESSEVTYVSTDNVRVTGAVEFEVLEDEEMILCGSLERMESSWSNGSLVGSDKIGSSSSSNTNGWSMDCYFASGSSTFLQPKLGISSPSIEVYIAGCCSSVPVILTKTIQISPRRRVSRHGMLDAIPEAEETEKEQMSENEFARHQQKMPMTEAEVDEYELDGKVGHNYYTDDMYYGEDGQLTWFNAGVRVGVGIGLGMCLGVGIGVGLLMRSYQATTRNFRRRFF